MIQYRYRGVSAGGSLVYWQTTSPDPTGASAPEAVTNVVQLNMPFVQLSDASAGKSWHTLLDVDFTGLADQTFSADGSVSLGGAPFSVVNVANAEVGRTMGILNGYGLRTCRGVEGGSVYWNRYGAPMLVWDMPAQVVNGVPVRCAAKTSATADTGSSWRGSGIMLAYPGSAALDQYCHITTRCSRGDVSQLQICGEAYVQGASHIPQSQPVAWGSSAMMVDWTWDIFGLDYPEGIGFATRKYSTWGQSANGQYTDLNTVDRFAWFPIVSPTNQPGVATPALSSPAVFQANNWKLCLLGRDNSTPQAYVEAVKFEAYY